MELRKNRNGNQTFKEKIYLANGSTKTKTFKRKTDAISWKRSMLSELQRNTALGIIPLKDNVGLKVFVKHWMETKILHIRSSKTIADYNGIISKHFISAFGNIPLRSFERSHADKLVQNLRTLGLTAKTTNKILMLFKQIFLFAEADGYLARTPFAHYGRLKVEMGRVDFLSTQEIIQLMRVNATEEIYPLLVLAFNTGMRIGELTGLCWDRVNFDLGLIEVSRGQAKEGLKNTTKTHLIRHIPMNPEVRTLLWNLMKRQRSPQYVFAKKNGEFYNPDHFSKRYFDPALERAGVRRITFHVVRHTYASQFVMNGGSIYDLQKILGHTSVTMTMKYAHISPQHLKGVVDTVRFSAEGNKSVSPFLAPREKGESTLKVVND